MLNVIINGCLGKMGHSLTKCINEDNDLSLVCGSSFTGDPGSVNYKVYPSMKDINEKCDVVIDFSHHLSIHDVLKYCLDNSTPLVIATTGFNDDELQKIYDASEHIPIFHSYNMSLGVNVLLKLVKDAAKMLSDFDIEVIEHHHNKKVDAPSGTAIMIANAIKDTLKDVEFTYGRHGRSAKREENEVGIHAVRGGTITGIHDVLFAGHDENINIKHSAQSKDVFAKGAITAAKYIAVQEKGYYTMDDMLGR